MKILLILALLVSCGIKIRGVPDELKHVISIDPETFNLVTNFCEQNYTTNQEVEDCMEIILGKIK